jgi:hypothetical protein
VTDGMGNAADILCGNIPTSNATVFVIGEVLMPKGRHLPSPAYVGSSVVRDRRAATHARAA